jgi:epoxyqueuosine reductase
VARYVWADHYGELRSALGTVAARLKADGWKARVLVDQNDLVDREAAYRAGLGWYGKNSNLLLPGHGSWFVLGSVVTNAPLTPSDGPRADGCGSCDRCIGGCPTGAIVAPGVIDARRCLAWLVQAPGDIPREHRVAMGDRMYGCDDCQDVCPPNRVEQRRVEQGRVEQGRVGDVAADGRAWVPLLAVLDATDDELLDRYGHWYIPERSPRYLRRNALVALGNAADGDDPYVRQAIARHLVHPDPMLRAHAVWAARRLGLHDLVAAMPVDAEPEVQDELAAPAPPQRVPAR